ncbi:MAG: LytR C-terminal domain-containing protein, partial [Solirubrobacterales bacterium]
GPPPGPPFLHEERSPSRLPLLLVGAGVIAVVILLVVIFSSSSSSPPASKSKANLPSSSSLSSTETQQSTSRTSTATATSSSEASAPPTSPAETHVVVLNATETAGLAHRLSSNLQQSGYTLAAALAGKPSGHTTSAVQYAAGHRADAQQVAQALGISQVQPLEAATAALSSGATVVVIAGADKSSVP